jgi:hypothetical protein
LTGCYGATSYLSIIRGIRKIESSTLRSADRGYADFRESATGEVCRIYLLGASVRHFGE